MNVERIFYWIRLAAEVILEIFDRPGTSVPEMKPERIQIWVVIVARAALQTLEGARSGTAPEMKPERIQFWLGLIARFVLAVIAGANGETGKSGDDR
jgi:hypothetical protein